MSAPPAVRLRKEKPMRKQSLLLGVAAAALLTVAPLAQAGVSVGIRLGFGFPIYPRPCCGPYFYRPYPVFVAPAPVYVAPAPVYVQPVQPVCPAPAPAPASAYPPAPVTAYSPSPTREGDIARYQQQL